MRTAAELKDILAAERTGHPFLAWRSDDAAEQQLLVLGPQRWRLTIGRDPGADLSIPGDRRVSRMHALLERAGQGWTFVDDGLSRNGSLVNGVRVLGRRRLQDRDRLTVGGTEITYRDGGTAGTESTAAITAQPSALPVTPMQRKVLVALCRPIHDGNSPVPATNREIAKAVHLSVDAVKAHLRLLFERCGLSDLPQNQKRSQLVATALVSGMVDSREFDAAGR